MILFVFPLRPENPFPVALKKGVVEMFNNSGFLLTGMGFGGAEILKQTLESGIKIEHIVEFGGAANISSSEKGKIHEITELFSFDGTFIKRRNQITPLPACAITGGDFIYEEGMAPEWLNSLDKPLLFSMETLFFDKVAEEFKIPISTIRIVTDNGIGDIKAQFIETLEQSRGKIKETLSRLTVRFY